MPPSSSSPSQPPVDAALVAAIHHLDVVAHEQELAVNRILGLVELLLASAPDRVTHARLEGILEACAFQDLAGQRLTKVGRLLRYLREKASPGDELSAHVPPTSDGLTQEQVDLLLRGRRLPR
ncbi:hypothetical protein [Insolitispirillum peregrinum]|uniref:hypothetical protein n=1 Tax=Insolitispirillum peregrinum TaxID=80876 RepID=UPI0009710FE2|nr:hypothetical protein [Insolitispirillum peregrinum]